MSAKSSAGGAATAGGMDFQHRVTAWVAAHILAEKDASPPWDLPAEATLEWLRCETEQPVDDLLVGTSIGGLVFAQIKRTLKLSESEDSDLASTLDQFVRQFIACQNSQAGPRPWDRPLDPQKDRLLLITSPKSSEPVRVHLYDMLSRLRNLPEGRPLEEAAANENERRALRVVQRHLKRAWQKLLGSQPSEHEVRHLLSLIRIHILDVEAGHTDEHHAKNLLRQAILTNPDQTDVAWAQLIELCAGLAAQRSGRDRPGLQKQLLDAEISIKSARSYQPDIEKLQRITTITLDALVHLSQIRVGQTPINIPRACTKDLQQAAEKYSLLVVGEPGAGKSGALHDLVKTLTAEGRDCVCLAVDRIAASSLSELRQELGLEREVPEVLDNWPGRQPAFLVIDALDAARGDPAAIMIRDLIRRVIEKSGRWRVVASIRKFDLRYGVELKNLFLGSPPTEFQDDEFRSVRHLNIPRLSEDELDQIASRYPELQTLIEDAPEQLRDLLQVPFNLRLVAEMLGAGVRRDELTPIGTQLELMDLYWHYRVIRDDGQGDARETLLREVCEAMVKARELRINRAAVARHDTSTTIDDLLSLQILVEWRSDPAAQPDRYTLAFAHHVLFDYAVSRLLLRGAQTNLVERLVADPDLIMAIRPSLVFHFGHLWHADPSRHQFWDLVFHVIREHEILQIGKLIGPSVASELSKTLSDLEPLCAALEDSNIEVRERAEQALRHLVGAVLAGLPGKMRLLGAGAGPWCELLERVSRNLHPSVAYTVRSLLTTLCDNPEDFTPEQEAAAGQTARRLLEYAWAQTSRDSWLVIHALQSVCRTFKSDPTASANLIRRCLEPSHLSQFGFEEMPWLAREIKRLIPLDPNLVEEIYRMAFRHQELSKETTSIGHSRILPLSSNRRQDYESTLYELGEHFPQFLEYAPEHATRALIAVMEAYVAHHHARASGERQETFEFNGQEARLRTDYSAIWDEGHIYRHHEPIKMLDAFQHYLEQLGERPEAAEDLRKLIQIVGSENGLAVLWRRLLLLGARFIDTIGRVILPLAWAVPILTGYDTSTPAGEFIRAIFPTLDDEARRRIEQAILSIPEIVPENHRHQAENVRNRLLGCLPLEAIVTEEARQLLEALQSRDAIPPNKPPVHRHGLTSRPYGEEEYLQRQGVPVEAEPNRKIRELERPVKEFANAHLNSAPSFQEITEVFPALKALHEALSHADADGVHREQRDYAWGYLAAACARAARAEELSCEEDPGAFVKDVLLEASCHPEPAPDPVYDAQFDESPSWGGPAARIEAAEGLVVLARHATCACPDVLEAVQRLSKDRVPAVRFQIASHLDALYRTAPETMWSMIDSMCWEDPSRGVLQGLLAGPFQRLAGAEPDRIVALVKGIFDRIREGPGAQEVRKFCIGLFTDFYIWRAHALCGEIVLAIASNPDANFDEARDLLTRLRKPARYGTTNPPDPNADAIRQRALDLFQRLLHAARSRIETLERNNDGIPFNEWSDDEQQKTKSLVRLIDTVGSDVYFASGAYDSKAQGRTGQSPRPTHASERFYREASPILDELATVGYPSAAHRLVETLEFFIPFDPRGVFLRIGTVVRSAREWGYQHESLAADLIVRIVERYLAEYRPLLRDDTECRRTLIEILDVFVQAGWPSARRLVYRLEEIFR